MTCDELNFEGAKLHVEILQLLVLLEDEYEWICSGLRGWIFSAHHCLVILL